jgi:hypothetical protein
MLFLGLGQLKQAKRAPVRGQKGTEPSHVVATSIGKAQREARVEETHDATSSMELSVWMSGE